jgi:DNA-directed RNA polymerase II subunit RPB2
MSNEGKINTQVWSILEKYFQDVGIIRHHIKSYNDFVDRNIQKILDLEPDITVTPKKGQKYTISFGDVYIPPANIIEKRALRDIYPFEARLRNLDYSTPVYIDITETLTENGQAIETITHKRLLLARIPVMLRSSKCHLSKIPQERNHIANECANDPGGYFIINGNERVLITQVRTSNYNNVLVLQQKISSDTKFKYVAEMRSISEETGHSIKIEAKVGVDDRQIIFSLPFIKHNIPVGVVFKALGYMSEMDILGFIGLPDKARYYMIYIIRDSYFIKTQEEALEYLAQYAIHTNTEDKKIAYARQVVHSELFPHLGVTCNRHEVALLLGHIVNKLLMTSMGHREPDDKDNLLHRRFETSGILLTDLFRTLFKRFTKKLSDELAKRPDIRVVLSKINNGITQNIMHCMSSSNWGAQKTAYTRTGVSQILSRLSYPAMISHLRRLNIPIGKEGKNTEIRQVHESQIGFICPAETPEGKPVGIVLNLSLLADVTRRVDTVLVREVLDDSQNLIPLDDVDIHEIRQFTKVFLNGTPIGFTEDSEDLVEEIKQFRNSELLDENISVYYEEVDDEVHICSDEGRLIRPVFTVKDGKICLEKGDGDVWVKLVQNKKIEYIDTGETQMTNIATTVHEIDKYYFYSEIDPSMMLGICASTIPWPDHSQSPRNCYQSSMGKQAMGIPALSYKVRADTMLHVLDYPQKALIQTTPGKFLKFDEMPSGINAIVAVLTYTGLTLV